MRICVSDEIKNNASKLICIDHHASNDSYGDLNYVDIDASSTCELVYNLLVRFQQIKDINIINEDIATCLYTGLVTDTGNFSYSNVHASSFEMAKNLLVLGAQKYYNTKYISKQFFWLLQIIRRSSKGFGDI